LGHFCSILKLKNCVVPIYWEYCNIYGWIYACGIFFSGLMLIWELATFAFNKNSSLALSTKVFSYYFLLLWITILYINFLNIPALPTIYLIFKVFSYYFLWGLNNTSGLLLGPMTANSFASKPEKVMTVWWASSPVGEVLLSNQ